jgi:hypothetical protein
LISNEEIDFFDTPVAGINIAGTGFMVSGTNQ